MGAGPAWLSLALTLPSVDGSWLAVFSNSLFQQLDYYDMQLIDGDTTRGLLSLTLIIQGLVLTGSALTRAGAHIGDWIYVTGPLWDSAAGRAMLQNCRQIKDAQDHQYLLSRHLCPQPRILQGQALRDHASAALISPTASSRIYATFLPVATAVPALTSTIFPLLQRCCATPEQALHWVLGGGEDYELCFTVPEINHETLDVALNHTGATLTCIGQIGPHREGIQFMHHHLPVEYDWHGYDHFKTDDSE